MMYSATYYRWLEVCGRIPKFPITNKFFRHGTSKYRPTPEPGSLAYASILNKGEVIADKSCKL